MLDFVKKIVQCTNARLTVEERSLLSVAYKNLTGSLRGSWRAMCQLEEIGLRRATKREGQLIRREKERIEKSLTDICKDAIELLSKSLIPVARPGDEAVFLHKMHVFPSTMLFWRLTLFSHLIGRVIIIDTSPNLRETVLGHKLRMLL